MNPHDEALQVAENMTRFGGNFCQTLATVIRAADHENREKIRTTWPEYWILYRDWNESKEED